jgi:hypothetical protein
MAGSNLPATGAERAKNIGKDDHRLTALQKGRELSEKFIPVVTLPVETMPVHK